MNRGLTDQSVNETPNLNKMLVNADETQSIGEFLEWLGTKGILLGRTESNLTDVITCTRCSSTGVRNGKECTTCLGTGEYEIRLSPKFLPMSYSIEELLAEYIGVDLAEAEREKRSILANIRN